MQCRTPTALSRVLPTSSPSSAGSSPSAAHAAVGSRRICSSQPCTDRRRSVTLRSQPCLSDGKPREVLQGRARPISPTRNHRNQSSGEPPPPLGASHSRFSPPCAPDCAGRPHLCVATWSTCSFLQLSRLASFSIGHGSFPRFSAACLPGGVCPPPLAASPPRPPTAPVLPPCALRVHPQSKCVWRHASEVQASRNGAV
jgi:hypothetical protein